MLLCIAAIHGIGFERPPDDAKGVAGYADQLHTNLRQYLAGAYPGQEILGNDPNRANVEGPVYVQSLWLPDGAPHPSREAGLSRLDDATPLAAGPASVAHVA